MSTTTQFKKRDPNGVVYSDPTDTSYQVRFKSTSSKKSLNGNLVDNIASEVIVSDTHDVTLASGSAADQISIRLRISGTAHSKARIDAILAELAAKIPTWSSENVFLGFDPTTLPANPE